MFGTNTTALQDTSYSEGYKTGVDAVMTDLNELMFDTKTYTVEERAIIKKIYIALTESYPA